MYQIYCSWMYNAIVIMRMMMMMIRNFHYPCVAAKLRPSAWVEKYILDTEIVMPVIMRMLMMKIDKCLLPMCCCKVVSKFMGREKHFRYCDSYAGDNENADDEN